MHRLYQRLDIPPLRLRPTDPPLRIPRIVFIPVLPHIVWFLVALVRAHGSFHHSVYVPFHGLLVESIEAESVAGWGTGGAGFGDLLDGIEGVDEYSVCVIGRE